VGQDLDPLVNLGSRSLCLGLVLYIPFIREFLRFSMSRVEGASPARQLLARPNLDRGAHWLAVSNRFSDHLLLATIRLLVTEKAPETPLARIFTRFLSASLSTTPSSVM
jgi:hypothetical protein